jgi:hypothetical protein
MIIWGMRSYVKSLAVLTLACSNGHTAAHQLLERTRKFTLFFIPLFPIGRSRFTVCTACSQRVNLSKEQTAQMLQQIAMATAPAATAPIVPADTVVPAATVAPAAPVVAERPRPTPRKSAAS